VRKEGRCASWKKQESIRVGLFRWLMALNGRGQYESGAGERAEETLHHILKGGGSYHGIWVDGVSRWVHVECACDINWQKLIEGTNFVNFEESTSRLADVVRQ